MGTSLEQERRDFQSSPLLAMPIAGTLAWTAAGIAGATLPLYGAAWALFIATGSTFGLALLVSRFTGEDLLGKKRPSNRFDRLFLSCIAMANLTWAIAIPFFRADPSSLPLSVGILAGAMWLPLSVIIDHWVGYFHAITRTLLIVLVWYLFPSHRFVAVPAVVVAVYLVSIAVLARRRRPTASPVLAA